MIVSSNLLCVKLLPPNMVDGITAATEKLLERANKFWLAKPWLDWLAAGVLATVKVLDGEDSIEGELLLRSELFITLLMAGVAFLTDGEEVDLVTTFTSCSVL